MNKNTNNIFILLFFRKTKMLPSGNIHHAINQNIYILILIKYSMHTFGCVDQKNKNCKIKPRLVFHQPPIYKTVF